MTIDLDHPPLRLAPTRAEIQRSRRPSRPRALVVLAWVGGLGALATLFTVVSAHAVVGNSDGATVVLEGQAMGTGNVLLHHWALSFDSFWTIDAFFYMLGSLVVGVRPLLLHVVPAVLAALVVLTGCSLARVGRRGVAAVAAVATVGALLALPGHVLAVFFFQGPLHVGTILFCLLAFAGLRHGRLGWGWAAAVVLLAAGALGDFQTVALGMVPAFVGGLVAMARTRDWRRGITTAAAPVTAGVIAGTVRVVTHVLGTFSIASANPTAPRSQIPVNLGLIGTWGAHMLGLGGGDVGTGGVPGPLGAVHVLGVAAILGGVAVAVVALLRGAVSGSTPRSPDAEGWRVDDLLALAFAADLCVFVLFTTSGDQTFSRYLTGAVVFGAVLAGRAVGRVVDHGGPSWLRRSAAVLAVGVVAVFAAGAAFNITGAAPGRPYDQLGAFLEAHHLDHGIGDYWSASITTVSTSDTVRVRPVIANPAGRLVGYQRQSSSTWFAGKSFQFLVYDTAHWWGNVDLTSASATFGPAARTYDVGTYRVLVWDRPLSVLVPPT